MKNLSSKAFSKAVLAWYDLHGRKELPWRHNISAYKVWLSEIMLQQTQVTTVLPYFKKFVKRFPSIVALAKADENEVLHYWSGLGYYTRARNLLKCARTIHEKGIFPSTLEELIDLPGIGRSTAGAILSIAFEKAYPILDGNVRRVLCRYAGIDSWPGEKRALEKLWGIATQYTPSKRAGDYAQAMMDLGATLCTRSKPNCKLCPLKSSCIAYQTDQTHLWPVSKLKKKIPEKQIQWLIIVNAKQEVLFEKRCPSGIWGGLWSFPEVEHQVDILKWCKQHYGFSVKILRIFPHFRHTFSHFHLDISPIIVKLQRRTYRIMENSEWMWHNAAIAFPYGLPSPTNKLLSSLQEFLS